MIRRIAKALAWSIGGVIALVVLVYGVALAINWRDEAPSAAAQRLTELYRRLPTVADEDNAFVYMIGMHAASSEDPFEVGRQRVTLLRAGGERRDIPVPERTSVAPAKVQEFLRSCGDDGPECATAFAGAAVVVEEWTAADPTLLPRYRELSSRRSWRDEFPSDISFPLASYSEAMNGQRLSLLVAYSFAERRDVAEVQQLLGSDARFWRTVLASADMLITKMIATAALNRHFAWGNLVLRRLEPGSAGDAIPAEWRVPLTDSERSMARVMTGEWLFVSSALPTEPELLISSRSWAQRAQARVLAPLFQPQATINRYADHYLALSQTFDAPLAEYPAALDRASVLTADAAETAFARPLYNPLGAVIFANAADFTSYAARVADVEGVRRAALAAATLRAAGVARSEVEASLTAGKWRSPYDDSPLQWDATEQVVVFRGLEPGQRGEHRFAY